MLTTRRIDQRSTAMLRKSMHNTSTRTFSRGETGCLGETHRSAVVDAIDLFGNGSSELHELHVSFDVVFFLLTALVITSGCVNKGEIQQVNIKKISYDDTGNGCID